MKKLLIGVLGLAVLSLLFLTVAAQLLSRSFPH